MGETIFKIKTFACIICVIFLVSCKEGRVRILVCPYKYAKLVDHQDNLAAKREILFKADEFSFLILKKSENGKVEVVQHYRAQHTFSNDVYPLKVSWEEPLHISTIAIIDNLVDELGVAIKIDDESDWRIYWVPQEKLKKAKENGMLYLPQYKALPFLPFDSI